MNSDINCDIAAFSLGSENFGQFLAWLTSCFFSNSDLTRWHHGYRNNCECRDKLPATSGHKHSSHLIQKPTQIKPSYVSGSSINTFSTPRLLISPGDKLLDYLGMGFVRQPDAKSCICTKLRRNGSASPSPSSPNFIRWLMKRLHWQKARFDHWCQGPRFSSGGRESEVLLQ